MMDETQHDDNGRDLFPRLLLVMGAYLLFRLMLRRRNRPGVRSPNKAVLDNVDLPGARIPGARMIKQSTLRMADLNGAHLQNARISKTDLRGANLTYANLRQAKFTRVDLRGADLTGADLEAAVFKQVKLDGKTTLPDGSHWSRQADWARFTDPLHDDYWNEGDGHFEEEEDEPEAEIVTT
jgi:hypothetical protein